MSLEFSLELKQYLEDVTKDLEKVVPVFAMFSADRPVRRCVKKMKEAISILDSDKPDYVKISSICSRMSRGPGFLKEDIACILRSGKAAFPHALELKEVAYKEFKRLRRQERDQNMQTLRRMNEERVKTELQRREIERLGLEEVVDRLREA